MQWHQLDHMQVSTSVRTDNQASTQFFTGRIPFLPPNQQRQSTEGTQMEAYNGCKTAVEATAEFQLELIANH